MTLKTWPTVVDRNVAQPSRVKLTPAYAAGDDVYDVTPIPGTVAAEGTLLNKALFDGEKAYIDQNDIPFVNTSGDGTVYHATVPQWNGLTAQELDGKLLVVRFNTTSNTVTPSININNIKPWSLLLPAGNYVNTGAPLPIADFLSNNRVAVIKFDYTGGSAIIISTIGRPYGKEYTSNPWSVSGGGTGANTAAGARANLGTPSYQSPGAPGDNTIHLTLADGTLPVWEMVGVSNAANPGGLLPAESNANAGWGVIATSSWPFKELHCKTLNGSLAASNITGVLPIGAGGTGVNSLDAAANALQVVGLGTNSTNILGDADLNTYKTFGNYVCKTDAIAATVKNTPFGTMPVTSTQAFKLTVSCSLAASHYIRQRFQEWGYTRQVIYERLWNNSTQTWTAWKPMGGYKPGTNITIDADGTINASIPGTYATGTGNDAQITSAYYIAPKTMVIDMSINIRAINGTGATVDAGSVTLPVAIRDAKVNTSNGFTTVESPTPNITGGGTALFNFTITSANTLKVNGQLQSGQNIAPQQVNAQIIIPVA